MQSRDSTQADHILCASMGVLEQGHNRSFVRNKKRSACHQSLFLKEETGLERWMSVRPGSLSDWLVPTPQFMLAHHVTFSLLLLR